MTMLVTPDGIARWRGKELRCALGRGGVTPDKVEGDGATPSGTFPMRRVLFRPDRLTLPPGQLTQQAIRPADGWCDDPTHADYNRPVTLPHPARCETMWRRDRRYDALIVLGHNDRPPAPGAGSAIFLHVTTDYAPTAGCIALTLHDLLGVISEAASGEEVRVLSSTEQPRRAGP